LLHATDKLYAFAGYTYSQKVAKDSGRAKRERTFEEIVPEHYWEFSRVFSDKESERLPEHQTWDHTIDLKDGAPEAIRAKVYPMPPNELKELDEFLKENLRMGLHHTLQISNGVTCLLHQEEGWEAATCAGLSEVE
jgi:hypothetical protein